MRGMIFKRLIKEKKNDIVHSSAYGKVQNGGGVGAASSLSFEKRMEINQHRKIVRGYGDSHLVSDAHNVDARTKKYNIDEDKVLNYASRGNDANGSSDGSSTGSYRSGRLDSQNGGDIQNNMDVAEKRARFSSGDKVAGSSKSWNESRSTGANSRFSDSSFGMRGAGGEMRHGIGGGVSSGGRMSQPSPRTTISPQIKPKFGGR